MNLFSFAYYFALIFCLAFPASATFAASAEPVSQDDLDGYLEFLTRINRYSPLEGAGSHGSIGFSVGAGFASAPTGEKARITSEQLGDNNAAFNSDTVSMPKAYLLKGLSLPVDLGLAAGAAQSSHLQQLSGHIQWTLYEALAMPAIAVRGSFSRLFGLQTTDFTSIGADLVASYGFLRFFNIYGVIGMSQNQATIRRPSTDDGISLVSTAQVVSDRYEKSWVENSQLAGLSMLLVPPYVTVAGEMEMGRGGQRSFAAKLSVGM